MYITHRKGIFILFYVMLHFFKINFYFSLLEKAQLSLDALYVWGLGTSVVLDKSKVVTE